MAEWLNLINFDYDNVIFKFKYASYLTEFDDGYDSNEDPDFVNPEGLRETLDESEDDEYEVDIYEESKLDEVAFEDTRLCFKGENETITWPNTKLSLGPCDHMCCKVWNLEPIKLENPELVGNFAWMFWSPMDTFLEHHGESSGNRCTDEECNNPNATGILVKASLLARASKIFNPSTVAKLKSITNESKISVRKTSV